MVDTSLLGLARRLGNPLATASGHPQAVAVVVRQALAEHVQPHRRYHTPEHLREMVAEVTRLAGDVPPEVAGAIAFHDVVYDPRRDDNEQASATRARVDLTGVVDAGVVAAVARLVLVTAGHEVAADDRSGALVVDADLWILASGADRYDRYVADVRAEYAHLDDAAWRTGRRRVLHRLRAHLAADGYRFGPPDDRAARTRRALANIDREVARLAG